MKTSEFEISIGKIVGTPTENTWAQTLTQGNLFAVFELTGQEVLSQGKEFFNFLSDKQSLQYNLALLKEVVREGLSKITCDAHAAIVKIEGQVCYVVLQGEAKLLLKRGEVIIPILTGRKNDSMSGSGFLKDKDVLILVTPNFEKIISQEELSQTLDGLSSPEVAEQLSPIIHGKEQGAGAACIILSFSSLHKTQVISQVFKKRSLVIAIILVAILLLSIVLGINQRTTSSNKKAFANTIQVATEKYEEGKSLLSLNRNLAYQSFSAALNTLEEGRKFVKNGSLEEKKLLSLIDEVNSRLLDAGKVYKVLNPDLFFDLTLIREDAGGTRFSRIDDNLVIADKAKGSVYTLNLSSKASSVASGDFKNIKSITQDKNVIYVLDDEGISRVAKSSDKKNLIIQKNDDKNGFSDGISIFAFLSNIYLLDRASNAIYKYVPLEEEGFSRRNYLASDIKPDFANAAGFTIDGEVFVILSDGNILRYLQGAAKSFTLSGLDISLNLPTGIFTTPEILQLYILDTGNKRIVVLDKNGNYEAQYQWEGIKDVTDITIFEGKMLLLQGSKIYSIELKL